MPFYGPVKPLRNGIPLRIRDELIVNNHSAGTPYLLAFRSNPSRYLLSLLNSFSAAMINKKVPKFGQKDGKRWCSPVMACSWILIIMWIAFLVYCWQSGLVDQTKIKALVGGNLRTNPPVLVSTVASLPAEQPIRVVEVPDVVPDEDGQMHVVFSTDCSGYQNWQTLLLFHSAQVVGQKGRITRIASGCDEKQQAELTELYKKLYPKFGAHFTPDFKKDAKTNKKCKYAYWVRVLP